MRSTLMSGTRVQYTQPPNGSLNGMPSSRTSVRLWPLGPIPRSDTPCVVGCAARLLARRKRLKVGIWRRTSSATSAGEALISSLVRTLTLAGTSPSRCSVRVAVTATVSSSAPGAITMSTSGRAGLNALLLFGESAGAHDEEDVAALGRLDREPAVGPRRRLLLGPDAGRMTTDAPTTTPPLASCTTPAIVAAANSKLAIISPPRLDMVEPGGGIIWRRRCPKRVDASRPEPLAARQELRSRRPPARAESRCSACWVEWFCRYARTAGRTMQIS